MQKTLARGSFDKNMEKYARALGTGKTDRAGEGPGSSPDLDEDERIRIAEFVPPFIERPGDDRPEQGADLGTRQEITATAGSTAGRIETCNRIVESTVDKLREWNGSTSITRRYHFGLSGRGRRA
jgi:hypothetical protein